MVKQQKCVCRAWWNQDKTVYWQETLQDAGAEQGRWSKKKLVIWEGRTVGTVGDVCMVSSQPSREMLGTPPLE